jgi:hypothetical protein
MKGNIQASYTPGNRSKEREKKVQRNAFSNIKPHDTIHRKWKLQRRIHPGGMVKAKPITARKENNLVSEREVKGCDFVTTQQKTSDEG